MDVELFLSVLMLVIGALTLAVRDRLNPFVGVRFGYTYLSKEAWRRANTFAGIYCIVLGLCFLAVSLTVELPFEEFMIAYLLSIVPMVYLSYRIAKESYEKEDLTSPLNEVKPMVVPSLGRIVVLQAIPMILYLIAVAILWSRIPETVAIHFGINGKPDTYASKPIGVLLISLAFMLLIISLTILSRSEPLLLRFSTAPNFLIVLQAFLAIVFFIVLLYNMGLISGDSVVLVSIFGTIAILILAVKFGTYRI